MDHAGPAHFEPTGVLADAATLAIADRAIDGEFDAWLDEREEVAAEPNPALGPEELAGEFLERALEVGHRDVACRPQALRAG